MQAVAWVLVFLCGVSAQKILFLGLNEKCRDGPEPWYCKKSYFCKGLKTTIKNGDIQLCGFSGKVPIVCCPDNRTSTVEDDDDDVEYSPDRGRKAQEMCRKYAEKVYITIQFGHYGSPPRKDPHCVVSTEPLIVGGDPAKKDEFPHMALIGYEEESGMEWFCGGSLISDRFIITAAHCNVSQYIGKAVARLGDLNIKKDNDRTRPINVKIVEVFDHPKYVQGKSYNDISLLKLERDLNLTPYIRPLCLHTTRESGSQKAIASGWGHTEYGGNPSDILLKVKLNITDDKDCQKTYALERNKLPRGVISSKMFCAGGTKDKDTCQGDSGGPLQIPLKDPFCMYSLIGITSFGSKCGTNVPGGYTRVSYYIPWIESIVWP